MLRRDIPELLDSDAGTPQEIAGSLADLRSFNWWLGGISNIRSMIEVVARETGARKFTLLDVASGSGYVPREVTKRLARRGIRLELTLLDRSLAHLVAAESTQRVVGDALALPFADGSFDLVSSSLFLHHLQPDSAVKFLQEALRVCRVAVLIDDLRRSRSHLMLAQLGKPLYRSRITRHDAPASVRRAYTAAEIADMAARAGRGAGKIVQKNHFLFRSGTILFRSVGGK
jgi:ubiquinone/menaquinone biosynthesis C-methylase UbiE